MERTITVKGVGQLRLKPDRIVLPITLSAREQDYERASERCAEALEALRASLGAAGFRREELKTLEFGVSPVFEGEQDERGGYRQVFRGYECRHSLRLAFPLDAERLSGTLAALAACPAKPEFSVQFTVKDQEAAKKRLLAGAAADAREKAELLCAASGAALGALLRIDYDWNGAVFRSPTRLMMADMAPRAAKAAVNIEPEDVTADESAVFVWEIS